MWEKLCEHDSTSLKALFRVQQVLCLHISHWDLNYSYPKAQWPLNVDIYWWIKHEVMIAQAHRMNKKWNFLGISLVQGK